MSRRVFAPVFAIATLALGIRDARGSDLQVAILVDPGLVDAHTNQLQERARLELDILAREAGAQLALVTCSRPSKSAPAALHIRDFGVSSAEVSRSVESIVATCKANATDRRCDCRFGIDSVDELIRETDPQRIHWSETATKRIVFFGRANSFLMRGRASAEEVLHRAERLGITFSALELDDVGLDWHPTSSMCRSGRRVPVDVLLCELSTFLTDPTAPLGRDPSTTRHATLLGGGTYHLARVARNESAKRGYVQGYEGRRALLATAYATSTPGTRDGLDDLAEGKKRPIEVNPAELPAALRDVDLEPLLDVVWDFVDARRAAASALGQVEKPGAVGARLAAELRQARRWPPSRR